MPVRLSRRTRLRIAPLSAMVAAGSLMLTACGTDPSQGAPTSDNATAEPRASDHDQVVEAARAAVERDREGIDRELPASGPLAVPGKSVWVIGGNMATEGSKVAAAGAEEAGQALGWDITVVDAKFDPATAAEQVRSAISAQADGILLIAIDCAWMPGALREAKDAEIVVYSQWGLDCEEGLFAGEQYFGTDGTTYDEYFVDYFAPALANYFIAETGGEGTILQLEFDQVAAFQMLGEAFNEFVVDHCPDCSVTRLPISSQDLAQAAVQAKVTDALTRDPDVNAVMAPFDGLVLAGVSAAVTQAEADGQREVLLGGVSGGTPNLEMIAAGGPQTFTAALPSRWGAWASMDGLNRAFAGAEQVDPGIGLRTFDVEHPATTIPYEGNDRSLGWEEGYRRIWATGSAE